MTDKEIKETIQNAIQEAKHLEKGAVYLVFMDKSSLPEHLGDILGKTLREEGFRFWIVRTFGPPKNHVGLYKVNAE